MKTLDIFDFYNQVKDQSILIEFKGVLSQEILIQMSDNITQKITIDGKIKKIFSIFIELAQNIMKYSAEKEPVNGKNIGVGIILLTEGESYYNVYSGNLIENENVFPITNKLDLINAANESELKNMYKEQSKKPLLPGPKGAGLGFIEIARKSTNQIKYQIKPINEQFSFLIIIVKIDKGV